MLRKFALAGAPAAVAAAALWWRRRPLPHLDGTVVLDGLGTSVRIDRDAHGVPHVDAASMEDAAFAMGYVHAQDRLWQLEVTRRVAAGRISEFAGSEGLLADRFLRRVGLMRVAEEEVRGLASEVARMLDAYAAGVNSVIRSRRPLPLEFQLLRLRPEPWLPVHSLAVSKVLALSLSLNWDVEMQRLELLRAVGPEAAARLDIVYPAANPTILAEMAQVTAGRRTGVPAVLDLFREAAAWLPAVEGGSNSWVVSGSRTTSGRPLLCNDPHLTPTVPSVWYAAHVRAGDDFESTGVTLAGLPFVVIGHNRHCAWGYTNSFADAQDLVVERFDGPGRRRYRTESGFASSRVIEERITVRGASDHVEEVVVTRHGPVVEQLDDPDAERWAGLALQWTALTPGDSAGSLLALQRAHDWDSFRDALAGSEAPSLNVVYADVQGHIGYFLSGRIPVRQRPPSGLPVPGWTGDATWSRYLSRDEVPQAFDPPEGFIVTANNRIVGDDYPHYIGTDYMNGYRARRIRELVDRPNVDAERMNRIQRDVRCIPAIQVGRLLGPMRFRDPEAERLRVLLAAWDGEATETSLEAPVFEAMAHRLTEHALAPAVGSAWRILAGVDLTHPVFGYPGNLAGRLLPNIIARWEAGDDSHFRGRTTWAQVAEDALRDASEDLRRHTGKPAGTVEWGPLHAIPLEHPLGQRRPLDLLFNAGSIPVGGTVDTVLATSHVAARPYRTRLWAPSWRQIMDVGAWDDCTGILFPGQSGHPASRHYRDLVAPWRANRQFPLAWSSEAVRAASRHTLHLVPAGDEEQPPPAVGSN